MEGGLTNYSTRIRTMTNYVMDAKVKEKDSAVPSKQRRCTLASWSSNSQVVPSVIGLTKAGGDRARLAGGILDDGPNKG
jgi:hypothetical protein